MEVVPVTPKHTDEEIEMLEHIKYCYDNIYNDWKLSRKSWEKKVEQLEARIKELEEECQWHRTKDLEKLVGQ